MTAAEILANPATRRRQVTMTISLNPRVENWRAGLAELFGRATFPAPSTSHAACGFPALRAPICFLSRLKLKDVFRRHQSQPVDRVVKLINPVLRGWARAATGCSVRKSYDIIRR
jgi:hypothetical protein